MRDWLHRAAAEGSIVDQAEVDQAQPQQEPQKEVMLKDIIAKDPEIGQIVQWFDEMAKVQSVMPQVMNSLQEKLTKMGLNVNNVPEIQALVKRLVNQS